MNKIKFLESIAVVKSVLEDLGHDQSESGGGV